MADFHSSFGWIAIVLTGAVGAWGILAAIAKKPLPRVFWGAAGTAMGAMVLQVVLGVLLYQRGFRPGNQHMFYGFVILFTLTFAYVYRATLSRRPALRWGLLLLFVMGLGIRGVMTFGESF